MSLQSAFESTNIRGTVDICRRTRTVSCPRSCDSENTVVDGRTVRRLNDRLSFKSTTSSFDGCDRSNGLLWEGRSRIIQTAVDQLAQLVLDKPIHHLAKVLNAHELSIILFIYFYSILFVVNCH